METFEEIRNSNNVLYKLKGKLSEYKEANVTVVPKTNLLYMHISDNSKAFKNGGFDKNASKFVSLNMVETLKLRSLMSTMDPKLTELVNSVQPPQTGKKRKLPTEDPFQATANLLDNSVQPPQTGKKRKLSTEDPFQATANLLDEFNAYQQPPYQQQLQQQWQQQPIETINNSQQQQQPAYGAMAPFGDLNGYGQQQQPVDTSANGYYQQQYPANTPASGYYQQQGNAVPQYYTSAPPPSTSQGYGWQQ